MPAIRHLAALGAAGLLVIVAAAACSLFGPELSIGIDNTGGPAEVTVTVVSSGSRTSGSDDVKVPAGQGAAWSVPLGSTWEVKVDGKHVIGSGDGADVAPRTSGPRGDVAIRIRVAADGTVLLEDAP